MTNELHFAVVPPLRCQELLKGHTRAFCGELAHWWRIGNALFADGYFCDAHRQPADMPLPAVARLRRVYVQACIYFSGVSLGRGESHTEAVDRLSRAVQQAGGVLSVLSVSSAIGEGAPPAPAGEAKRVGGGVG